MNPMHSFRHNIKQEQKETIVARAKMKLKEQKINNK